MMMRLIPVVVALLLVAGCRAPGEQTPKAGSGWSPKMGPSLDRLVAVLNDPAKPVAERDAYWDAARGKLMRANGVVREVTDRILIECPPTEKRAQKVCVSVLPDAKNVSALPMLHKGQPLGFLGQLSERELKGEAYKDCPVTLEVRNARLYIR